MEQILSLILGLLLLWCPQQTQSLMFLLAMMSQDIPHARDQEMIENFELYKQDFERLRSMILEDSRLERVDMDWTSPADPASAGVTLDRIETYRELCRRIGVRRGIEAFDPTRRRIHFLASTQGLSISGSCKGYAWLADPPMQLEGSLDGLLERAQNSFTAYRHLEGGWFLYLDFED